MDYGRRPYASPSTNYRTFMSEITDQYVKSIGGVRPAGLKRPYVHANYNSLQYLFNTTRTYLGGSTPSLTDLDWAKIQSIPVEKTTTKQNQLLILNFEGVNGATTWTEEAQGLIPEISAGALDATNKKFGSASLGVNVEEECVLEYTLPNTYTGDFTFHGWARWQVGSAPWPYLNQIYTEIRLYNTYYNTSPPHSQMNIEPYCWEGAIRYNCYIANEYGSPVYENNGHISATTDDGWHHIAMIGYGNCISFAIDGFIQGVWVMTHPMFFKTIWLYAWADTPGGTYFNFDAWELVNYAKWFYNFTPPTTPPRKET